MLEFIASTCVIGFLAAVVLAAFWGALWIMMAFVEWVGVGSKGKTILLLVIFVLIVGATITLINGGIFFTTRIE